jgi:hypothetical protein
VLLLVLLFSVPLGCAVPAGVSGVTGVIGVASFAGGAGASSAWGGADGSCEVLLLDEFQGMVPDAGCGVEVPVASGGVVLVGVLASCAKAGHAIENARLKASTVRALIELLFPFREVRRLHAVESDWLIYGSTSIEPVPLVTDCLRFLYLAGMDIFPFP